MRLRTAIIATLLVTSVALAGCTQTPNSSAQPTDTEEHNTPATETRFDGDANTEVTVFNPTNETWNASYRVTRNGTTIFNKNRTVDPDGIWNVATYNQPGNYTFSIETEEWSDSVSTRLPRAVGDRKSFVRVVERNGQFQLLIIVQE